MGEVTRYGPARIYRIALKQRQCVLACLTIILVNAPIPILHLTAVWGSIFLVPILVAMLFIGILALICAYVTVYQLLVALGSPWYLSLMLTLLLLVPVLDMLIPVITVARAAKVLRREGQPVGFFGMRRRNLQALRGRIV